MVSIHVMNADAEVEVPLVGDADLLHKVETAVKQCCIFARR